jgi:predicted transcriptional regulator
MDVLGHVARIVAAHVAHNLVPPEAVPPMISSVYATMSALGVEPAADAARPLPAVPIKKSVSPDYIICLEDGKPLKMLKRYLQVRFNLTPEDYRQRWGLPADYPMIAPTYSASRARLAKEGGLGRKRPTKETPAAPDKRSRSGRRGR